MKFWIDKENEMLPDEKWQDSYVFSLNRDVYSTIFTNMADTWYWADCLKMSELYEDLFLIGISIFALDKRVSRRMFIDCWTRDFSVSIPVLAIEKWSKTTDMWNKTLSFLTGDNWDVQFRSCQKFYSQREKPSRVHLNIDKCDCVSLFSGGLDSFCGAIKLLEEGRSPCFVGHNEYPKLRKKQELFISTFQSEYEKQFIKFISFTANSRAPRNEDGVELRKNENTSRGRSLLFLCAALSIAGILGKEVPVYIPENGFIGLNLPLTHSRIGTCSTRTTHPYFINNLMDILSIVGIHNPIQNFFAYYTKREIVNTVKEKDVFKKHYMDTISCSHPCLPRYNREGNNAYPINCGYCYPCLIRKASLLDCEDNKYSFSVETIDYLKENEMSEKTSDLRAVLNSVYRYKKMTDGQIKRMIQYAGYLDDETVNEFLRVYKVSMEDLIEIFSYDGELVKLMGG